MGTRQRIKATDAWQQLALWVGIEFRSHFMASSVVYRANGSVGW